MKIGLVMNPLAGVGGPAGLKGSDGVFDEAMALGSESKVFERVLGCIRELNNNEIEWVAARGSMGGDLLNECGLLFEAVSFEPAAERTTAEDTRRLVGEMTSLHLDLLLFAGGDGTARDVYDAFSGIPAVLGIPCGVKMHSGVFATSPGAAAELINKLIEGELLSVINTEVRDIDEASFRDGVVKTTFYGELPVIDDLRYMQQTKVGGREVEELVLEEIAADFVENRQPGTTYIMGSGSTVSAVLASMGLNPTLLGIDVMRDGELIGSDVSERQILDILESVGEARIVVTAIGGQGHILGRGNQQISPAVIRAVGVDNIDVIASKRKLSELDHRPLLVDTGDRELDAELRGMKSVLTGYDDRVLYRIA